VPQNDPHAANIGLDCDGRSSGERKEQGPSTGAATTYTQPMLVDRAFRFAFRNYSTLWLIVASVVFPLHLAHGYVFRDVIAVSELHPAIELFPERRQVARVSAADLAEARRWYAALTAVEVAFIPALAGAVTRVLEEDLRGGVPGALRAWGGATRLNLRGLIGCPGPLLVALVISFAAGWLAETTGRLLVEPLPPGLMWIGAALTAATARSLALPLLLATMAMCEVEGDPRVQENDPVRK
jgi:hypothetical protein